MLVLFRFKNFGPFKEESVLDMRAVKAYKEHPYNLINFSNQDPLVKVAAIYGANASGKSHFVNAYRTFSTLVRTSFERNNKDDSEDNLPKLYCPYIFCSNLEPTEFEAIYRFNGYEYRYGFIYNMKRIEYEWLYKTSLKTNRQSMILERSPSKTELGATVRKTCEKYIDDIDSDVLALSFLSGLKLKNSTFKDITYCVSDFLPLSMSCDAQAEFMLDRYFEKTFDEQEKPRLMSFLNAVDVGIKDIEVERNVQSKGKYAVYTYHMGNDHEIHRIPIDLESDGTRRAIAMYSFVRFAALYGKGLIIDELNNQLHPLLQKFLIDLLYEESMTGQLIYTTHDTTLLDKQFVRRDQVWFIEKNDVGESSLYSLADFKIRNDVSFEKDYLSGVYGGIPVLKKFTFKDGE